MDRPRSLRDGKVAMEQANPIESLASTQIRARFQRLQSDFRLWIGAEQTTRPISGAIFWALSGWIGLASGLAETGLQLFWRRFEHQLGNPDLWVNSQAPWMIPLSLAIGFAGLGLALGLTRGFAPRTSAGLVPCLLIALGTWSILGVVPGLHPWMRTGLALIVGYKVGRQARFDSLAFQRFARIGSPWLLAVWLVLFVATGVWPSMAESWAYRFGPKPAKGATNVLLVVLDTVRADNLSLQGYPRPTTPRLSEWARRGVQFNQARSTSPYTLGSHASLFTGHWASETSARVDAPLDDDLPTLAEHFRDQGYATGGFVGNIFYGSTHYGLDRGFLRYQDFPGDLIQKATAREFFRSSRLGESLLIWFELKWRIFRPMEKVRLHGEELNHAALTWIEQVRKLDRPFFLFMNYFDAHSPYSLPGEAPHPFSRLTADRLEVRMKELERVEKRHDSQPLPPSAAEVVQLQEEVNTHLRDAYDDGISWVDRKLDELLRALERRGLLENTVIVVTADHGEMLGEHEVIGHGKSLNRQVVHVPLVVIDPRSTKDQVKRVVDDPVSIRDVPSTILDLVGDPQSRRFPGRSLRKFWSEDRNRPEAASPVVSEMEHLSWRPQTCHIPAALGTLGLLTEGRWSYHRRENESQGVAERLFDFVADPGENVDLAGDLGYRAILEGMRGRFGASVGRKIDPR
jgi:arylsulfatase A-like enzyme